LRKLGDSGAYSIKNKIPATTLPILLWLRIFIEKLSLNFFKKLEKLFLVFGAFQKNLHSQRMKKSIYELTTSYFNPNKIFIHSKLLGKKFC